ncbi:MAG: flagellin [Deltaproteobacteria bacterium]|nr:flagellin [Deltaproteobacteria bacterium]
MGLFINTNTSSINARRKLTDSSNALGRSFERLSSGLRINSARDDAAGLAITNRMTAQIRGLDQAVRNSNDGISLAQTAEGALNETTNLLQRIRELAVQSASDNNNPQDRASLNEEVQQLVDEVNRIAMNTSFNGNKILNGDIVNSVLQVGANVGETLTVRIDSAEATQLSRQMRRESFFGTNANIALGTFNIGTQIGPDTYKTTEIRQPVVSDDTVSTFNKDRSAIAKAAAINDAYEFTGVRAIVGETTIGSAGNALPGGHAYNGAINGGTLTETDFFVINGFKIAGFQVLQNDSDNSLVDAINAAVDETGVLARLDDKSQLVLTAADGRNIDIVLSSSTVRDVTGLLNGDFVGVNGAARNISDASNNIAAFANNAAFIASTYSAFVTGNSLHACFGGQITLQSNKQVDITFGTDSNQAMGVTRRDGGESGQAIFGVSSDFSVNTVDISTRAGSVLSIEVIDLAIEQISAQRASLGAIQNRLESTINNLTTNSENLSASRSRILDADFATETANLSRNQIIQQAGVSILAQANQQPQIALSLLGQ